MYEGIQNTLGSQEKASVGRRLFELKVDLRDRKVRAEVSELSV